MSDEHLFREVEEELRREQIKALWDKFGVFVIAGAFIIVAAVAGYKGWQYWQAKQAAQSGERFVKAQALAEDGKSSEALQAFEKLAEDGPRGYQILAKFRLASVMAAEGKTEDAVKAFESLARDSNVDGLLQGYAALQAAFLRVDKADVNEMNSRLGSMTGAKNPWRHSAREVIGMTAYRTGSFDEAQKRYNEILADVDAPENLRRRAEMMLALTINETKPKDEKTGEDAKKGDGSKKPEVTTQ